MDGTPQEFMMQAWKQQLDAGLRAIEAMIEGATRMHEMQLEAATQAHADAVATQLAIASAASPAEILRLQAEWTQSNAGKCVEYWRSLQEAATQTGAKVAGCLCAPSVIAATQGQRKAAPVRR